MTLLNELTDTWATALQLQIGCVQLANDIERQSVTPNPDLAYTQETAVILAIKLNSQQQLAMPVVLVDRGKTLNVSSSKYLANGQSCALSVAWVNSSTDALPGLVTGEQPSYSTSNLHIIAEG